LFFNGNIGLKRRDSHRPLHWVGKPWKIRQL